MAKRMRRVSDLPEWFNLANYRESKSLDVAGWYEQLSVREALLCLADLSEGEGGLSRVPPKRRSLVKKLLALIRATPIVDVSGNDLLRACFHGRELFEGRNLRYAFGVQLATVRHLYLTEANIEQDKRIFAQKYVAAILDEDWLKPQTYKYADWIDEPVDNISDSPDLNVNVRVNLSLPNKVLIEQFKQMLQSLRSPLQRVGLAIPTYPKPDFSSWIRFGILPYLDLRMWQYEAETKIPNRVMADAIFLPGEGGEEVVRKTTAKLAGELLSKGRLRTLAALAAQEIAERNNIQVFPEKF